MAKKRVGRESSSLETEVVPQDDVYQMEDIVDYKVDEQGELFRVKWKGYPMSEATWEPESNILEPGDDLLDKMRSHRESHQQYISIARTGVPGRATKRRKTDAPTVTASSRTSRAVARDSVRDTNVAPKIERDSPPRGTTRRTSQRSSAMAAISSPIVNRTESVKPGTPTVHKDEDLLGLPKESRPQESSVKRNNEIARVSGGASARSSLKRSSAPDRVRIVHISKDNTGSMKAGLTTIPKEDFGDDDEVDVKWITMTAARKDYKDELLDYLLERVRFKETREKI